TGCLTRYGAGLFFCEITVSCGNRRIKAQLMSSFSLRGVNGSNVGLLKGQPEIPPHCRIPSLPELPPFAQEYRVNRSESPKPVLYETDYEIVPTYDINGVGLLYFAAYPIINDICAARRDPRIGMLLSTTRRDVFYLANSEPTDKLAFRLHDWRETSSGVELD